MLILEKTGKDFDFRTTIKANDDGLLMVVSHWNHDELKTNRSSAAQTLTQDQALELADYIYKNYKDK